MDQIKSGIQIVIRNLKVSKYYFKLQLTYIWVDNNSFPKGNLIEKEFWKGNFYINYL